jgi:hypothetical protein
MRLPSAGDLRGLLLRTRARGKPLGVLDLESKWVYAPKARKPLRQ